MPYSSSFLISLMWGTVSKAFLKSKYTMSTLGPWSIILVESSKDSNKFGWHECCLTKPCWRTGTRLCSCKWDIICFLIILSRSLHIWLVGLIGLWLVLSTCLPFLKIEVTVACFHSKGSSPVSVAFLKSMVREGQDRQHKIWVKWKAHHLALLLCPHLVCSTPLEPLLGLCWHHLGLLYLLLLVYNLVPLNGATELFSHDVTARSQFQQLTALMLNAIGHSF